MAIEIADCRSDAAIAATFPVMRQLRPHLIEADYLAAIRAIEAEGGRLIAAYEGDVCVGCSLFRQQLRLSTGPMIYVDDLVTDETRRSAGVGQALLDFIQAAARAAGLSVLALDSGVQRPRAHRFYFRNGFGITSFAFKKALDRA